MAIAQKGNKTNSKLGMVVLGDVGTRKSEFALESTTLKNAQGEKCKVLYIDIENGSISDRLERFEKDYKIDLEDLYIIYTQSFKEVLDYIKKVKNNEPFLELDEDGNETENIVLDGKGNQFKADFIIIDGAALLWDSRKQALIEVSKRRTEVRIVDKKITGKKAQTLKDTAKLEGSDWQQLSFDSNELISSLVGSGANWIVTSFAKDEMEIDETGGLDNFGNQKKKKTGKIINDSFKGLTRYAKTVLCLSCDEYGDVKGYVQGKDRSETFPSGSIINDPHLKEWQNVVLKSKDTKAINTNIEKAIHKDADALIAGSTPPSAKTTTIKENTTISIEDLRNNVLELLSKDGVASKKEKIATLKTHGLGNPSKETDIERLKKSFDILSLPF